MVKRGNVVTWYLVLFPTENSPVRKRVATGAVRPMIPAEADSGKDGVLVAESLVETHRSRHWVEIDDE